MKTKLSILVLMLFAIIGVFEAQARGGRGYGRGPVGMDARDCFPGVDLSQEQIKKILSYQLKSRNILTPDQAVQLPAGCSFGFGNMFCGQGQGYGRGRGHGFGRGRGHGYGRGCW